MTNGERSARRKQRLRKAAYDRIGRECYLCKAAEETERYEDIIAHPEFYVALCPTHHRRFDLLMARRRELEEKDELIEESIPW